MDKIFITAIVLYALFVALYLLRLKTEKRRKKEIVGQGSALCKTVNLKTDIVGKSKFVATCPTPLVAQSAPQTATASENPKRIENPHIFTPGNEVKPSAAVASEELDEVFSDTPPQDGLIDIYYPLEYELDDETEELEGTAQAAFASGVLFEDLGNAVRTVNRTKEATSVQKIQAGDTLLEIRRTDMFEQLVSKPDARATVTELMNASLSAFYQRKDKEDGKAGNGRKAPDSFDIRDFA